MTRRSTFLWIALVLSALPATPEAWEGSTTHAGLSEEAALASSLHQVLIERFGLAGGLYGLLTVESSAAKTTSTAIKRRLSPSQGYSPDSQGNMKALGWLVAGSVLADRAAEDGARHFLNPARGPGSANSSSALTWIRDRNNPARLAVFENHVRLALTESAPRARNESLALALYSAGALLHVLCDMGSPSRVRDDVRAHQDLLAQDGSDIGSRFERVAALAYSRLGVPPARSVVRRPSLDAYFTSGDRQGLADITHDRWFSAYTVPRAIGKLGNDSLVDTIRRGLSFPLPGPAVEVRLADGKLVGKDGVCLANIALEGAGYDFSIGDSCALEQLAFILPTVASYGAGFIDQLFGPELKVSLTDTDVTVSLDRAGGRLILFWDDAQGKRTRLAEQAVSQAGAVSLARPPEGAVAVIAVHEVTDAGQPRVAAFGRVTLSK